MACLIDQGKLPVPDIAVFADTGREAETTWMYQEQYIAPMLRHHGLHVQIAPHSLANVDLYGAGGKLLIPAWTTQSGKVGRFPTFCSTEWKKRVVNRWLRQQGVKSCEVWLGITCDEASRMKDSGLDWLVHRYPLIDLFLKRADCLDIIRKAGLPEPAKSSCWMCPHRGKKEWAQLTESDMQKAREFDALIREFDKDVSVFSPRVESAEEGECDAGFCWT
jgi:hypothetical protein